MKTTIIRRERALNVTSAQTRRYVSYKAIGQSALKVRLYPQSVDCGSTQASALGAKGGSFHALLEQRALSGKSTKIGRAPQIVIEDAMMRLAAILGL